jgi:alcohol dehydrogenase
MLANDWEVIGNSMYPKDASARLMALVTSGLIDLNAIAIRSFAFEELAAAMAAAARMRGLDMTVLDIAAAGN